MKYGYFDDSRKEYVITTPETPYPWINYLGTKDYFAMISNNAGGYSFYKDARLRRITRFRYNNVPLDLGGGKYYYVFDNGNYWSPAYSPVRKKLDEYECRHGMGYTIIKGKKNDIAVTTTFFVPLDFDGEVHRLQIKNEGSKARAITLFSLIEWSIWDAQDDATNFQRNLSIGAVEVEGSVIYNKTEYRERRNHYAFYSVNTPIDGFDTDRDEFLGKYNGFQNPTVVEEGKAHNSVADGWYPIASHAINISLEPNETKELVFVLGYTENKPEEKWEDDVNAAKKGTIDGKAKDKLFLSPGSRSINKTLAKEMISQFATSKQVEDAITKLKTYWEELLSKYVLIHPDEKLCRMVNIWNQYQCMVTFNMSRSASYFESGIGRGMGFRDSNQDLLGFVHQIPESARQRILDLAATQLQDGGAYHQYQPLTKRGNNEIGGNFNDDPLWLVLAVTAYVKETGDFSILQEMVPFENEDELAAPLTEHLKRALNHVTNNLGPHELPLIGRADWNDCLNLNCFSMEPGESFQTTTNKDGRTAESILIAGMYATAGSEYVALMEHAGDTNEAERIRSEVSKMQKAIMEFGYDGEWFLRAYDDLGRKVGSKECEEGKIFIEPQGFCIMGGCGLEDGKAKKALESVDKYLATKYGLVLNYPAFSKYYVEYGEISCYPAGYKENAGIFCHNNAWIICAEAVVGNGAKAYDYYTRIAPAFLEEQSEVHYLEPYVYAQMAAGKDASRFGQAKNSWLTGTASWNFVAISQYILGISADYDGLKINPAIPERWERYQVIRKFRGDKYEITVLNPDHVSTGIRELLVDGNVIKGTVIPYFGDGKEHAVKVTLG